MSTLATDSPSTAVDGQTDANGVSRVSSRALLLLAAAAGYRAPAAAQRAADTQAQ